MKFGRSLLFLLLCLPVGCGYRLAGQTTHLPSGVDSIAIPTLTNQTLEPGLEIHFTQAFLREFIQDKRVRVVNRQAADCTLEGIIKSFTMFAVSFDTSGYALEYQTIVIMDLTLKKRDGIVLWREKDLMERAWYRTSPSVIATEDNKNNAIQQIARSLAEKVRNRFFYNF